MFQSRLLEAFKEPYSCTPRTSPDASKSKVSPEDTTWGVQFKLCGDHNVPLSFPEKYIFKSGFLAQVTVVSDTAEQQCKQALAYNRMFFSNSWSDTAYTETAQLQASQIRTFCRKKAESSKNITRRRSAKEDVPNQARASAGPNHAF